MTPINELRGFLFETYVERGYDVWALPKRFESIDFDDISNLNLEDLVKIDKINQFQEGRSYLALPPGINDDNYMQILYNSVTTYIPLTIIPYIFKMTKDVIIAPEMDTFRQIEFTIFEFINAIEKLPIVNRPNSI